MAVTRDPETYAYATRDGVELCLDVYRPSGLAKCAVLMLHGGGWRAGSKEAVAPSAKALASLGFLAIPVQYRLLGQAPWPAQIHDVKSAVRWVGKNSGMLGIDTGKIAIEGFSAGAHLALLAAGTPDIVDYSSADEAGDTKVAAVVAFFPPVAFVEGANAADGTTEAVRLLEGSLTVAEAERASPVSHIARTFPPTCLLHGTNDHIVGHAASMRVFDALTAAGVPVDLHLFSGQTHAFSSLPSMVPQVQAIAAAFLDRHVVDPDAYANENRKLNPFADGKRP